MAQPREQERPQGPAPQPAAEPLQVPERQQVLELWQARVRQRALVRRLALALQRVLEQQPVPEQRQARAPLLRRAQRLVVFRWLRRLSLPPGSQWLPLPAKALPVLPAQQTNRY